jgi:hypothetical protein
MRRAFIGAAQEGIGSRIGACRPGCAAELVEMLRDGAGTRD